MTDLEFLFARKQDWPALIELAAAEPEFGYDAKQFLYLLSLYGNSTRIARAESLPVAGLWMMNPVVQPGTGWLEFVVVASALKGRGLGRAMLDDFEQRCTEWGYARIGLAVDQENDIARRLYHAEGWELAADNGARIGMTKTVTPGSTSSLPPKARGRFAASVSRWTYRIRHGA